MFKRSERITNLNYLISQVKTHLNLSAHFNAKIHEIEVDVAACTTYMVPVVDFILREKRAGGAVRHASVAVRLDYSADTYVLGYYDSCVFTYLSIDDHTVPAGDVGKVIVNYLFKHLDNLDKS